MIRSSIGYFSTPHIAAVQTELHHPDDQSSHSCTCARVKWERDAGRRPAAAVCGHRRPFRPLWQPSHPTPPITPKKTSTPPCQPTGFRVASKRPRSSCCPLIPSAAHKVRRRVVTGLYAFGFPSVGCRQNWACLGSQEPQAQSELHRAHLTIPSTKKLQIFFPSTELVFRALNTGHQSIFRKF